MIRNIYRKYMFSSFLAILGNTLGQVVNNIVIGNFLKADLLSVTVLAMPVYYLFATIGNLFGVGGSVMCSRLMGIRKFDECKKTTAVVFVLAALASIAAGALLLIFMPNVIRFIGTPEPLIADTQTYITIITAGGITTTGIYIVFNFLRLDGQNKASIFVFLIMAIVNILLDLILLGPMKTGVAGIAAASVAGAGVAVVIGLVLLIKRGRSIGFMRVSARECAKIGRRLVSAGSTGALENICILLRSFSLNHIIGLFGVSALTVLGVVNSINSFSLVIIAGIAGSLVPFIGVFSTEHDIGSIKQVVYPAVGQGAVLTGAFILICTLNIKSFGTLFGIYDNDTTDLLSPAIMWFCISLIPAFFNYVLIHIHMSNGRIAIANILTVSRTFLGIVAPAFLLSFLVNGSHYVWAAYLVGEILTMLIAFFIHLLYFKKNRNLSPLLLIDESAEKNGKYISYEIHNSTEDVMRCVKAVGEFCETNELDLKKSMLIALSLEEMLLSILAHCLNDGDKTISVRLLYCADETTEMIIMRIRYEGREFNPIAYYEEQKANVDTSDPMSLLDFEDSLGIKMVIETTEVADYRRTLGINNLLILL